MAIETGLNKISLGATAVSLTAALTLVAIPEPSTSVLGAGLLTLQNSAGSLALVAGITDFLVRANPVPGAAGSDVGQSATGMFMGVAGAATRGKTSTLLGLSGFLYGAGATYQSGSPPGVSIRNEVRQRENGNR